MIWRRKKNSNSKNIFGSLPQNHHSMSGQVYYSVSLDITQDVQDIFSMDL